MAQHRRDNSSGQDSAVHLHLKKSGHVFEDSQMRIMEREDRWFERGVKEAIHVELKKHFKPEWWPKTLSVTHIKRSPPLTGAKFLIILALSLMLRLFLTQIKYTVYQNIVFNHV